MTLHSPGTCCPSPRTLVQGEPCVTTRSSAPCLVYTRQPNHFCSSRVQAVPHTVLAPGQQQYSPGRGGQARHWSTPQKSPTLPQQSSSLVSPGRGLVHCGERSRSGCCGMQRKHVPSWYSSSRASTGNNCLGSEAGTALLTQFPSGTQRDWGCGLR